MLRGETGIGWSNEKGTVDASGEWWQKKIQAQPESARFRDRGPFLVHDQELLFSDVVATGESAWTPSSGIMPPHLQDEPEDDLTSHFSEANRPGIDRPTTDTIDTQQTNTDSGSGARTSRRCSQFPAPIRQKKQKKTSTAEKIEKCLERMVNTIESDSHTSRVSKFSAPQYSIKDCMETLERMAGIKVDDSLWMYATRLFLKPPVRELFLTIKGDNMQLMWLQGQMENDNRKTFSMTFGQASREESNQNDDASTG